MALTKAYRILMACVFFNQYIMVMSMCDLLILMGSVMLMCDNVDLINQPIRANI